MDSPTSAAPDKKTPSLDLALAKEKSQLSGQLEFSADRFNSSVARLTSNSIGELQGLVSELQKMQEFLTSELDSVQRQINSAVSGINIIVETIGPFKSIADSQTLPSGTRNVRTGSSPYRATQSRRIATVGMRDSAVPLVRESKSEQKNDWQTRISQHGSASGYAISKPRRLEDRRSASYSSGELLLNRICSYGWVEMQGEKHHTAIRLTPAGLQAMRSAISKAWLVEPAR